MGNMVGKWKLLASVCLMFAILVPTCAASGADETKELQKLHRTLIGGDDAVDDAGDDVDPDAKFGLKIKVSEVCWKCIGHIEDTAEAEWRMHERFSRENNVPAKIKCTVCKGTGRKMVNGKPHEETVSIQARTKAFSNTIKEFVMKRYPPNKEILHFAVEYVVSNNVAPFDNQGESMEQAQGVSVEPAVVNQGDPVEPAVVNQGDPVEQAVLLDLTRTSKWKRIKNRWFITTDRNTKMFLKYLTERKRFAFRNRTHAKIARNEDIIRKL